MSSNHQLVPFIPPSVVFGPDKLITAWRIVWRLQILQGNLNKYYKEIWTNTIRQSGQQGWRWQGRLMDLATEGISHGLTLDRNARPLVVHLCPAYSHLPPVPPSFPLYQYPTHPIVMLCPTYNEYIIENIPPFSHPAPLNQYLTQPIVMLCQIIHLSLKTYSHRTPRPGSPHFAFYIKYPALRKFCPLTSISIHFSAKYAAVPSVEHTNVIVSLASTPKSKSV